VSGATAATPIRLAHRGDHRRVPENTLEAFAAALAVPGCGGLELDVRAAADGTPIVLHDRTLLRVQGRAEAASSLDVAALAASGVPTLDGVLARVGPGPFLDIELKEDVVDATVAVVRARRGDPPPRTVLSSFAPTVLAHIRSVVPGWPTWLNADDLGPATIERARALGCAGVAARWPAIGARSLATARAAGLDVAAWTVRRRPTADRLARLGVVAICVEGPALEPR